jgi:hypothetical protein
LESIGIPEAGFCFSRFPRPPVSQSTHVLAFAEARHRHVSIVARLSTDSGRSFGPAQVVAEEVGLANADTVVPLQPLSLQ